MKSLTYLLVAVLGVGSMACFGADDSDLTDSGKGRPVVEVEFPAAGAPGSVHDAVLTISNPGPGDMDTVVVAFATVGPSSGQREFPDPIVVFGVEDNPSVESIEPPPTAVSADGIVYTFGPLCADGDESSQECQQASARTPRLAVGETITLTFSLRLPDKAGIAANSVQIYDGAEIDRARGVRLEIDVGR